MAKKKEATTTHPIPHTVEKKKFKISPHWIYIPLLFIIIGALHFSIAFLGDAPLASDASQWRGSAHVLLQYNETHKDQALWDPNIFGGMPSYLISLTNKYPFLNEVMKLTNPIMNWRIFMLVFAGIGMYLLMLFLGFEPFVAFLSALAFAMSCHWVGLIEIGHNTKFKAIMYIPWIIWGLLNMDKRRWLLGLGILSVFMIAQLRESHPQISYYVYLFMGMYWIYRLIETIRTKEWKGFGLLSIGLIIAFGITSLAIANPYLSTMEYGKYTIRGGATGLDTSYAQGWSFHPLETLSFLVPDFFGGAGQTYWGWMEFNQIYNYAGIIIVLLAFIALWKSKNHFVWFLGAASFLILIMSFGKFWPGFSDLLLKYLPGFNKFRVPSMILVIVQFTSVVMAGYGIKTIVDRAESKDTAFFNSMLRLLWISAGIGVAFLLLSKSLVTSKMMIRPGEAEQYGNQLSALVDQRMSMMTNSFLLSWGFLLATLGMIWAYGRKMFSKGVFYAFLLIAIFADLQVIDSRFLQNLSPEDTHSEIFTPNSVNEFLLQDKSMYRIFPLSGMSNPQMSGLMDNGWAYYHQTIGGYHGAKLKRYQEVLENCIMAKLRQNQINWNVLNMLNAKYIIFQGALPFPNTKPVFAGANSQLVVSQNMTALPRAWFVNRLEKITDPKAIWAKLNSDGFLPRFTAIVEEDVVGAVSPDSTSAELTSYDLHKLSYKVYTNKPAFLTVSEIYYPAGWNAYIDGKPTHIYATNYILRGVVVPAGHHTLEMRFEPKSYQQGLVLGAIGLLLSLLCLGGGIFVAKKHKQPTVTE